MADYAGACAAIRSRLASAWSTTRITYQNETPAPPWPPTVAVSGAPDFPAPAPWVHLEIAGTGSTMVGAGVPGKQAWRYDGVIYVHVFVPAASGVATATQYAVNIGEIFRAAVFYHDAPGCYVRTWSPRVDGGGDADQEGAYYRVTMACPFEYWHRG